MSLTGNIARCDYGDYAWNLLRFARIDAFDEGPWMLGQEHRRVKHSREAHVVNIGPVTQSKLARFVARFAGPDPSAFAIGVNRGASQRLCGQLYRVNDLDVAGTS